MMRRFVADLHVHTLLSPCAAVEMTPRNIVWHAVEHKIDIIAITDHNACDNIPAALEAAKGTDLTILLGMEVESKEEVHLIILFDKMSQMKEWEQFTKNHMSGRLNDVARFGAQFIVDADDNLIAEKPELLLASLTAGVAEISEQVKRLGGICIASHIDRPIYSIISQLGFIPPDVELAAVEVSRHMSVEHAPMRIPAIGCLPVITASDAHVMEDFVNGPKTAFYLEQPTLGEIRQALLSQNLRKVVV
ncbi:PHP domain-containing protein [Sporomusa sp.]|uniref:PHP domain-containing protein n=1 Tax=Sporomusa sp. TaxID=2078658 RepID=UPI002C550063|nr:PHP domain-containing protein [Sporomusa sp.]HWR43316.1 PHP domain-containing protein [Sporomusa sp.]